VSPSEKIADYARGWAGLMKLVRNGHSWSGSEQNRFFLNGKNGSFHEMSHLAGLDQIEDGRGLAIVDWDQDGRLDLWYRNRNAPRLRLMLNRHKSPPSIALKLQGTTSNRDAIGAVVELLPAKKDRLVRSVRAGDLFLSQSSKWLHFGLGSEVDQTKARVIWPGGEVEIFVDLSAGRFLLQQGTGKALALPQRAAITLKPQALEAVTAQQARIILPARVPFPKITFRNQAAQTKILVADGKPRLLILWSGTCNHCETSLQEISKSATAIRTSGLEVLALSVDGISGPATDLSHAYDLIDHTKFTFPWGLIDAPSISRIHNFQAGLFDRTPPPTVPLLILLDEKKRALAIYRGETPIAEILEDWQTIRTANETQLYHFAPPLSGTWFTNPLSQREVDRLFQPPSE
jgi:hypothetical protein